MLTFVVRASRLTLFETCKMLCWNWKTPQHRLHPYVMGGGVFEVLLYGVRWNEWPSNQTVVNLQGLH